MADLSTDHDPFVPYEIRLSDLINGTDRTLTVADAARGIGVSTRSIERYMKQGCPLRSGVRVRLPWMASGRRRKTTQRALVAFRAACERLDVAPEDLLAQRPDPDEACRKAGLLDG